MSSTCTVCGVCEYQNINKPSVVWCLECDEGLCEECKVHHAASKATRDHSVVLRSDYQNLPSNILENTQTCPKHDEKYVIFCRKHDIPCCRRCVVETHNDCKDLNAIEDVIKNVKSSNAFLEMEKVLKELSENLQNIRKDRQENIKSLRENRTKIEKEVQQTRSLINNHLDRLQENLTKELYDVEEKENKSITNIISSIEEKERKVTESQTILDKVKQHASDLQTFLAMKHIQGDVTINEQFLESLIKEEKINNTSISWKNENAMEILSNQIKKIGTIILDTRPGDTILTSRKNQQAQIVLPTTPVPSIDDVKLALRRTVKTIGSDIISCCFFPDGRMGFSCYASYKIHVLKTYGSLDFTLKPGSATSHIDFIENSQKLLVTSGFNYKYIKIINVINRKTEKTVDVGTQIYGIVHKDEKLFYNGESHGLHVVNLDDGSDTQLVNVYLTRYSSIALWSDKLYVIGNDDSVTCCDLQGTVKWKVELYTNLKGARGITVDNYGRVYVSGYESNNVVVISTDGSKHRVLLSGKDGLKKPQSLCFNRKNNNLLIANQENDAFIYDILK
ncbi:uncharacterized protein LOC143076524 [Mytilus galloprovincialis]|uniref:uncharacterized protein LOC143076524 n=1 Tax=Mytilus galloprovincialis TaxID=29158 RepID=UPI003F7CB78C